MTNLHQPTTVRFFFDPVCPWAWRTSLWIREVTKVRPVVVTWDFLSLQAVNHGKETLKETHFKSEQTFRTMALLRRRHDAQAANDAIDRLYLAVGEAAHTRKEDIGQADIVDTAIQTIGLDPALRAEAMEDSTTLADVLRSHEEAIALGGFGVPTLVLNSEAHTYPEKGTFGPVISAVPEGEDAGDLWDHVTALLRRPEFFELKRSR